MKKILFISFLFLIFFNNFSTATEINIKSEYTQGETLIAKISGDFITSLSKSNIFFYKGHTKVSFEYDITKIGYDYYLYAILTGKSEGNYSLSLENLKYNTGGIVSEESLVKNFSITNQTTKFSVKPGWINTAEDFSLSLKNLKDFPIDITISVPESTRTYIDSTGKKEISLTLGPGETERINFLVTLGDPIFQNITLSSGDLTYNIPLYLQKTILSSINTDVHSLGFQSSPLIIVVPTDSDYKQIIYLYNLNDSDMEDVSFTISEELSSYASLDKKKVDIMSNSNTSLELLLYSPEEKEVEGYIYADVDDVSTAIFLDVQFLENSSDIKSSSIKNCSELGGVICNTETNRCNVNPIPASDGWCCIGICENKDSEFNFGKFIAIILILSLIGFAFWFYFKKYKRSKKPVDLLKIPKH
jgi:hypothetical protein